MSVFSSSGIPCLANMASSLGMTDLADDLYFWEAAVFWKSPEGNGPRKSIASILNGPLGSGVICRGSIRDDLLGVTA